MKRSTWRLGLLMTVLALVAAACGGTDDTTTTTAAPTTTAAAATTTTAEVETTDPPEAMDFGEPTTLTLGHPFPEQHPIHQGALIPFAEAVNEATDGTITIEFHPGGALAPAPQVYDNTQVGGQDIGWALQGYTAGRFPATEVIELPFQFESAVQATEILWTLYDEFPQLQAEYDDAHLLGLWVHDIGDLWTKDKKVETLEDIAGLSLRFPTPVIGDLITEMGGVPVGMPAPQIFDSLSTGVIDGLMIAVSGLQSFQLYDELAYGVECDCYVAAQWLTMNQDVWDGLTPDAQAAIDKEAGRVVSLQAATVYDGAYASVSAIAVEEGVEKLILPEDELARWHALGDVVIAAWIAERDAEGLPGQAMFDRMQELIEAG